MFSLPHDKTRKDTAPDQLRLKHVDLENSDKARKDVQNLRLNVLSNFRWKQKSSRELYFNMLMAKASSFFSLRFPIIEKYLTRAMVAILVVGSLALYLEGFSLTLGLVMAFPAYWVGDILYDYLKDKLRLLTNEKAVDDYLKDKTNRDDVLELLDRLESLSSRLEDLSEESVLSYTENLKNLLEKKNSLSEKHLKVGKTQYAIFRHTNSAMDAILNSIEAFEANVLDVVGDQIRRILILLPRDLDAFVSVPGPYISDTPLMSSRSISEIRSLIHVHGIKVERTELSKYFSVFDQFIGRVREKRFLLLKPGKDIFEPFGRYVLDYAAIDEWLSKVNRIESPDKFDLARALSEFLKNMPIQKPADRVPHQLREYASAIREYQYALFDEGADESLLGQDDVLNLLEHYETNQDSLLKLMRVVENYIGNPSSEFNIDGKSLYHIFRYLCLVHTFTNDVAPLFTLEKRVEQYFRETVTCLTFNMNDRVLLSALRPDIRTSILEELACNYFERTILSDLSKPLTCSGKEISNALISEGVDLGQCERLWSILKHPTPEKKAVLSSLVEQGLIDISVMIAFLYSAWKSTESGSSLEMTPTQHERRKTLELIEASALSINPNINFDNTQQIADILSGGSSLRLYRQAMNAMSQQNIDWSVFLLRRSREIARKPVSKEMLASAAIVPAVASQISINHIFHQAINPEHVLEMFRHSITGAREVLRRDIFSQSVSDEMLQYSLLKPSLYLDAVVFMIKHGLIDVGDKSFAPEYLEKLYALIDKGQQSMIEDQCRRMSSTVIKIARKMPDSFVRLPLDPRFNKVASEHLAMMSQTPIARVETWFHVFCKHSSDSAPRMHAYSDWLNAIQHNYLSLDEEDESKILLINLLGRDDGLPNDLVNLIAVSDISLDKVLPKRGIISRIVDWVRTPVNTAVNNLSDSVLSRSLTPEYRLNTREKIIEVSRLTEILARFDLQEFETHAGQQSQEVFDYIEKIMRVTLPEELAVPVAQICIIQKVMRDGFICEEPKSEMKEPRRLLEIKL